MIAYLERFLHLSSNASCLSFSTLSHLKYYYCQDCGVKDITLQGYEISIL